MPPTFDEQVEWMLQKLNAERRSKTSNWRVLAHYRGEEGKWFILAFGKTLKGARAKADEHREYLEVQGPAEDPVPHVVEGERIQRWDWGRWREWKAE